MEFHGGSGAFVSLDAVKHNFLKIKASVPESTKVMCVIKADAYGHGAEVLAPIYEALGAGAFGVATVSEAVAIRKTGTKLPILILGYTPTEYIKTLLEYDITQCVFSAEYAKALSAAAVALGKTVKVHIKIDTGMSRIGFVAKTEADVKEIYSVIGEGLCPEGVFTHLSSADIDEREFTLSQLENFSWVSSRLCELFGKPLVRHAANSAAIIDYPEFAFDMVRAGIILYGMTPSDKLIGRLGIVPVMKLRSEVSLVKEVEAGTSVGYSRRYIADAKAKIATVQIGYADGFFRYGSRGGATLTVCGRAVKTVGNVCMDQLMLDVSDVDGVKMGDEVIIFGEGGRSAEALAAELGTICYELTTTVGARVPRIYTENGKIVNIKN